MLYCYFLIFKLSQGMRLTFSFPLRAYFSGVGFDVI